MPTNAKLLFLSVIKPVFLI